MKTNYNMLASLEKISQSEAIGLYKGKMGIALCYFKQYHITKDKSCLSKGKKLLNHIAENIGGIKTYGFSDGLLGIGWGIEWLVQNKYLKADTNLILSDIDDEIYRLVLSSKPDGLSLEKGTLARLLYLYKRVTHKNKFCNFYQHTVLIECLILCINELFESIVNHEETDLKQTALDAKFLSQVFIFVNKVLPLRLDRQVSIISDLVVTKILYNLREGDTKLDTREKYLYANALLQAGSHSKNKIWIGIAHQVFRTTTINGPFYSGQTIYRTLYYLSKSTNDYSWQEGWLFR